MYQVTCRLILLVYGFFAVFLPSSSGASQVDIAVIYPDVAAPYNEVLTQIIAGIREQAGGRINAHPLPDPLDIEIMRKRLGENNIDVMITLGRRGVDTAQALGWKKPLVIGAVSLTPPVMEAFGKGISAIRLVPDPDLLFAKLRKLMPQVQRVIVIIGAREGGWLKDAVREAAKRQDMDVIVHDAPDTRVAARLYREVMDAMDPGKDVLWLPPEEESVDIRSLLPVILQGAWDKNIAVISSNPVHVKRGALFSMYPDNRKMGRRLAVLALAAAKGGKPELLSLQDLLTAVNVRTAEHLSLPNIINQNSDFELIYPSH